MDLPALIAQVRVDTDDLTPDYFSTDANITAWLNEAEQEACIRSLLIHDTSTASVCNIAVTAGTSVYSLHPSIIAITRAGFTPAGSGTEQVLYLTDITELDRIYPAWRKYSELPKYAIQNDTTLQLASKPSTDGTLALECHRLPLLNIEDQPTESPEIGRIHHRHLVQWVLHRAYSRPDAEIFNPNKAATALAEFTRVFGLRPDATTRRSSQANRPHRNRAIW